MLWVSSFRKQIIIIHLLYCDKFLLLSLVPGVVGFVVDMLLLMFVLSIS